MDYAELPLPPALAAASVRTSPLPLSALSFSSSFFSGPNLMSLQNNDRRGGSMRGSAAGTARASTGEGGENAVSNRVSR